MGFHRKTNFMKRITEQTGVHVIAGTGRKGTRTGKLKQVPKIGCLTSVRFIPVCYMDCLGLRVLGTNPGLS